MNAKNSSPSTVPLFAGLLGGAASTVLLYPLDLVKVRLQVNENSAESISLRKRTIMHTLRGVVRHEGVVGLYQGLTPALLGSAASWGGYFFFYESMKTRMVERKQRLNSGDRIDDEQTKRELSLGPLENFTAACSAGAIMVGMTNPLWLIKTRMQLQMKRTHEEILSSSASNSSGRIKPPYKNIVDAARTIVREEGLLALYKGAIPALMLTSHGGVQFVAYEFLKENFGAYSKASRSGDIHEYAVLERLQNSVGYLTMGAVSKMYVIASTITYPIQVIKSRLQQRSQTAELLASGEVEIVKREYYGVIHCASKIWKCEGFIGFFKGAIPNALRVAPSAAITFVVYETVTDELRD